MGKGHKGVKWGEGTFSKADKAVWMSAYNRNLRTDPSYRIKKRRDAAAGVSRAKAGLRSGGCVLCGYSKCAAALEFHHIGDDKERDVGKIRSATALKREAAKCIVVCANCHREIHAGQIEGYEDVRRAVQVSEEPPLLRLIAGN
jgi:hypothetical protein